MPTQQEQQHVDAHRKLLLRRDLLRQAIPGAAYVPFCGDGDIAAELYADRRMIGCDLDPDRLKTIRARLPAGEWIEQDADDPLWGRRLAQETQPFAVADFDSYAYPYDAFRVFWEWAPKAQVVVMFFTDGQLQTVRRRAGDWRQPDGTTVQKATSTNISRVLANAFWTRVIDPWIAGAVAPYRVMKTAFYQRAGRMVYWGVVVAKPVDAAVPARPPVSVLSASEKAATPETPDALSDEDLGYDPLRRDKFNARAKRRFLKLLAEGSTLTAAGRSVGVTLRTVERHLATYPRFAEAAEWAQEEATAEVEASLFMAAKSGNVTAIQVWLYNRAAERWADRRQHSVKLVADEEALKLLADIISRTVTDQDTLARLRAELARFASAGAPP